MGRNSEESGEVTEGRFHAEGHGGRGKEDEVEEQRGTKVVREE